MHVIGRTQEMNLAIQVKNLGEDSFESLVKVQLPEGVSYINVLKVKSVSGISHPRLTSLKLLLLLAMFTVIEIVFNFMQV